MGSKSAIGIGNGICFKQVRDKGGGSYIDPLVRNSIVGLWKSDQNTNESPTRNIIKNTIKDKGGDLELLNFGYKLNSGYGKYIEDFSLFTLSNRFEYSEISNTKITITAVSDNVTGIYHAVTEKESALYWNTFKIKVSGSTDDVYISYITAKKNIRLYNGINTVVVPNELSWHSFSASKVNTSCNITLEFVPEYEGALVTDGVDDLIVSQKTSLEIIGGDNRPFTVISMISVINNSHTYYNNMVGTTNMNLSVVNSTVLGKTGIFGYTSTELNTDPSVVNNILGDKNDYSTRLEGVSSPVDRRFSVTGYLRDGTPTNVSSIAWYWTFIANKALTTNQINQVISYFNLDKHVKPDIIYDTIRQGITNENHASFNDELVDFSGNGHNMKIYNSAWNKESGINDEGAWQADGVTDYGQYIGDLGLQDYTIAVDRAYVEAKPSQVSIMSNVVDDSINTPFLMEHMDINKILAPHSFGKYTVLSELNINRFISYQSTYKYNGIDIIKGTSTNTGSGLTIGRIGGVASQYANIALWSLLLFPYSLSEFLLERQLKRYKLGTLYPDMVEFRPIIKNNNQYRRIDFYTQSWDKKICPGDYVPINSILRANIYLNNELNELQSFRINGVNVTFVKSSVDKTAYNIGNIPIAKSPQKIDITIDEYIRFEDIIRPYPAIINLSQDGKSITWGDKLKVGSKVTFVNHTNILPNLYDVSGGVQYNGTFISWNTSIRVEKSMVFVNPHVYKKGNEPSCILAPQTLRIPNSSYKILGYIPDLTGKGNHGRLNNFAYTEESGANEDGSIRFDGTDDHIIIPTIKHGGKALLMKVNWRYKNNIAMAYDQRINLDGLGISISRDQLPLVAYKPYNKVTYIDGIKNESILVQDLEGITHNIIGIYDNLDLSDERDVCISRTSDASNSGFADMSMYEFMLFPDVPNEEEIKELNKVMGIKGGYVESPNYYYDAYGKKNTDTDRNLLLTK